MGLGIQELLLSQFSQKSVDHICNRNGLKCLFCAFETLLKRWEVILHHVIDWKLFFLISIQLIVLPGTQHTTPNNKPYTELMLQCYSIALKIVITTNYCKCKSSSIKVRANCRNADPHNKMERNRYWIYGAYGFGSGNDSFYNVSDFNIRTQGSCPVPRTVHF